MLRQTCSVEAVGLTFCIGVCVGADVELEREETDRPCGGRSKEESGNISGEYIDRARCASRSTFGPSLI